MGAPNESNDHISIRRLIQNDLGMTCRNHLTTHLLGGFGNEIVNLALAQDFQMRIGFIYEQNRLRMCRKVSKCQKGLLLPASARLNFKARSTTGTIVKLYLAPFTMCCGSSSSTPNSSRIRSQMRFHCSGFSIDT